MQAKQELLRIKEKLQRQISALQVEMATIDKAIQLVERESGSNVSMGAVGGQDKRFAKSGLTDALRAIIGDEWMSPVEARDVMMQGGFKTEKKGMLLSSVYATLKRLAERDLEGKKINGKMQYRKRQPATAETQTAA